MLISDYSRISNYPFTENSTLKLYNRHRLSPGVITGASIYPNISGGLSGYVYVAEVSTKRVSEGIGALRLYDSIAGDISTDILFPLSTSSSIVEGSVVQQGRYCGSVTATTDLLPTLMLDIKFSRDAFVFTPSVYHPRLVSGSLDHQSDSKVFLGNNEVKSVHLSTDDFDSQGSLVFPSHKAEPTIKYITINGNIAEAAGGGVILMAAPGSYVRTLTNKRENTVELGGADDLSTQ